MARDRGVGAEQQRVTVRNQWMMNVDTFFYNGTCCQHFACGRSNYLSLQLVVFALVAQMEDKSVIVKPSQIFKCYTSIRQVIISFLVKDSLQLALLL